MANDSLNRFQISSKVPAMSRDHNSGSSDSSSEKCSMSSAPNGLWSIELGSLKPQRGYPNISLTLSVSQLLLRSEVIDVGAPLYPLSCCQLLHQYISHDDNTASLHHFYLHKSAGTNCHLDDAHLLVQLRNSDKRILISCMHRHCINLSITLTYPV
jgi:hypothetical protein